MKVERNITVLPGVSIEIRNAISSWTQKDTGERFYTHYDIATIYSGLEKLKYNDVEEILMGVKND